MKITTNGKWLLVLAVALLCFAPCALAQTDTLELTGVPGGYDAYGYGSGPYSIQVGPPSGPTYNMICDDFYDEIGIGSQWSATATSFSNLSTSLFGNNATEYTEALTLAYAILFNTQGASNNDLIQLAIWAIFDSSGVQGKVTAGDWATIQVWIAWAAAHPLSAGQLADFVIWTPTGCSGAAGSCAGQEFFQYVPEGGAALLYLLLAGVSCFGAMFFRSRNQSSRPGMA